MLKLFRQRKTAIRVLLGIIVLFLGAGMLVYLVPTAGSDASLRDPRGHLAEVAGRAVTVAEADREYRRRAEQFGSQSEIFRQLIYERVVDDLIRQRAMEYEAERLGLKTTPEDVAARLRQLSVLYPDGRFIGAQAYQQLVAQEFQMSVPEFEDLIGRQAQVVKLIHWVTEGVTVSPGEIAQAYRERTERAKIEYVLFRPEDYVASVQLADQELRAEYEKNRERYQRPERRAVRYVGIDYQVLFQRVTVSPGELEGEYQRRRETYSVPERVRFRHILFLRTPPGAEKPREAAALRKLADDALAQLKRGKDFAALAKQLSEDPATRERGGETGWVQRGQALPELDQAIFSTLKPGGPPAVVETQIGVHVVQLLEYQPARVRTVEEVRGEIEPVVRQQKTTQMAVEEANRLVQAVRGGKTLEQAAKEQGWAVRESGLFARNEQLPGAGPGEDFQDAAFRLAADSAGKPDAPVSDPVSVPAGYAILQLKQVEPMHVASFEEVRGQVEQSLRQARAGALAREAGERMAAEVAKTGTLRAAGAAVKTSEEFGRFGAVKDLGSVSAIAPMIFSLPVGAVSPAKPLGRNWIVFRVVARQDSDPARMTPEQTNQLRQALLDEKRGLVWNVFQESTKKRLQDEGVLKINQAAVDRLLGKKT